MKQEGRLLTIRMRRAVSAAEPTFRRRAEIYKTIKIIQKGVAWAQN